MKCLYCGGKLAVTNSRSQKRSNQIWRRRKCRQCLAIFTSHEAIDTASALLVETKNGPPKPFLIDKLFTELLLALQDRSNPYQDAREVAFTVVKQLLKSPNKPIFEPAEISQAAAGVLKRLDRRAWLRFQAEHPSLLSS